ncbi:hypothetical protein AQUCO_01600117v1 [Aquilegia coerulea]|uniref:Uncharacterized protein n=1 Tax=Aquilegia coerulea TaxID=218851 RepID=A0A2G5DQ89_AQUCA|nr:hypothetical protein AQUCO_01600117v1 [Aquilegia coerulea]
MDYADHKSLEEEFGIAFPLFLQLVQCYKKNKKKPYTYLMFLLSSNAQKIPPLKTSKYSPLTCTLLLMIHQP